MNDDCEIVAVSLARLWRMKIVAVVAAAEGHLRRTCL